AGSKRVTSWNSDMKYLSVFEAGVAPVRANRAATGKTANDRCRPRKNWIVLNVEPIALAFKANVLHRVKPLTMPID
ncbi:hypothetical protein, partial [Pseudomonas sp.]|uniref:hypothetical protein n=1 Tax=Pseudomonas sp. TaxID=306 RepID=UPI002869FD93